MTKELAKEPASNDQTQITLTCLQNALNETQETIRAYDTKAEILGALLTIAVGTINYSFITSNNNVLLNAVAVLTSLSGLIAIGLLGVVIFPMKNPKEGFDLTGFESKGTYYVLSNDPSCQKVSTFVERVKQTDWYTELSFELLKSAKIRDRKHKWFKRALNMSALTLLLVAILVVLAGIPICRR